MSNADRLDVVVKAIHQAQAELLAYAEPPYKQDVKTTVSHMFKILDDQKVVEAVNETKAQDG
jgi:hypothetical protein